MALESQSHELYNREYKQRTVIATWLLELKLNTLEEA